MPTSQDGSAVKRYPTDQPDPRLVRHVMQGGCEIVEDRTIRVTAILGSCVAACLYDTKAGIGGMNHFLLPEGASGEVTSALAGANAMELLINGLLKAGARRSALVAKVFGGAQVVAGLSTIGLRNSDFVRSFLAREAIPCAAASLGGRRGRRIEFHPASGRVKMLFLASEPLIPPEVPLPASAISAGQIELF